MRFLCYLDWKPKKYGVFTLQKFLDQRKECGDAFKGVKKHVFDQAKKRREEVS